MSSSTPQLFIIAGPNGAGKSTTSEKLLKPFKIKAFDWDKEFYVRWSEFGYDPLVEQGIRDATNELFSKKKKEASLFRIEMKTNKKGATMKNFVTP